MWAFVLFLAWPLLEIGLFVTVGGWIGLWSTLAVVILTALLGVTLVRRQGMGTIQMARNSAVGSDPLSPMAHQALLLLGGVLLILPGFFTDVLGLLLMIPPVRGFLISRLGARITLRGFPNSGHRPAAGDWVEGEFQEVETDRDKVEGPSKWTRH